LPVDSTLEMPMSNARMVAPLLAVALLLGCGGRADSPFANLAPAAARQLARDLDRARAAELNADLKAAFAVRPPRNVLILSGGDADGAFGCGVLAGWRDAAGEPRPTFDVVTGVSTGALMSAFAFLGEPRDDATLRDVYTNLRDGDVMEGPFTPGKPNSVFDTGPLRRLIARHVTPDAVRRVAAAHRAGRRLYAATVELDSGSFVIWPLSKIAAEACPVDGGVDPAGVERFRQVLLAAASIPVVFPPVEIDGGLHVDAGIREAVFLRRSMLGPATRPSDDAAALPTVWAIVNGKLSTQPEATGDHLPGIGVRSLGLYTESLVLFSLRDAAHLAAAHDPPFRFRWIAEPDDLERPATKGLLPAMFDPTVMSHLYHAGRSLGRSAPWHEGVPDAQFGE
jgi:hypothetical protein